MLLSHILSMKKIIQIERYVDLKMFSLHEYENNLDKYFIPEIKPYILKQIVRNIENNLPPNIEEKKVFNAIMTL